MLSKYWASVIKKRRSSTGSGNQMDVLKQAPEVDQEPKNQQNHKEDEEAKPSEDKQTKYLKVPTEFQVLHPLRKEADKKQLRWSRKRAQTAFVARWNPEYDAHSVNVNAEEGKPKSKAKGKDSCNSEDDEDQKKWDILEPEEAVRSFKLVTWCSTYLGVLQSAYSELEWRYLVSKIPDHEIGIEVAALLFPFLFLLCIWDLVVTSCLDLVQMTQIPLFGLFMVVYAMGYPLMLYGYIIRHCYGLYGKSRRSRLAFAGIVLYPLLFLYFCVNDIVYQYSRNESGIYYHLFKRGPDDQPDDYDPSFDYATKDYRSQYALGHYTFYDVSPSDLNTRMEEEDKVPVKTLSAEDRLKIMTMT